MQATDRDLWRRLEAFELDDPAASLTFTRRLARENGWEVSYAARVVEEYKRFVFLAMTAGHEVTPSDEVDQAWHLHLTYTRSYWGELCGEVLGRPLHHGPTKGGAKEGQRFEGQYEATLASYRESFGEEPPTDIWPPSEVRFGEAKDFVRVNRQHVWLLPKPWRAVSRRPVAMASSMLLVIPPLAAGAAINPLDYTGTEFLKFYGVVVALAIIGSIVCRRVMRTDEPADARINDEDPLEVGALRSGWVGAFHSAFARLLADEALTHVTTRKWGMLKHRFVANRDAYPDDGEIAKAILVRARLEHPDGAEFSVIGSSAKPDALRVEEELAKRGLLETGDSFQQVWLSVGMIMGATLCLGGAKLLIGMQRNKPVEFLAVMLVVTFLATIALMYKPRRTRVGERELKRVLDSQADLKKRAKNAAIQLAPAEAAMAIALLGVTQCNSAQFEGMHQAIRVTDSSSGGCGSSGSGDGGGGCGGGCGGCGGD
jgi:uncharacterized protein (TIGR04222 family)